MPSSHHMEKETLIQVVPIKYTVGNFFTASTVEDLIVFFSGRGEKLVVYFGLCELPLYF